MKKLLIALITVCAVVLSSCKSHENMGSSSTYVTMSTPTVLSSATMTDLDVKEKISYKYVPTKAVERGGLKNVVSTAVSEALKANDNADVLVALQYEVKYFSKGLSNKIEYIIIKGYPAKYTNFKPMSIDNYLQLQQTNGKKAKKRK